MDENHDIQQAHRKQILHRRWKIVLTTVLVALVAGRIFSYHKPAMNYIARVKFAVEFEPKPSVFDKTEPQQNHKDHWSKTDLQIITSSENMRRVVHGLNLAEKWGFQGDEDAAVLKLSSLVKPSYESETNLIVIEVSSKSREEATELANAVGDAYVKRRNELTMARAESSIAQLQLELNAQKRTVDAKRAEMLRLMKHYDVKSSDGTYDILDTTTESPFAPPNP